MLIAGGVFIALAIWGWDVPAADVARAALWLLVGLLLLALPAAVLVGIILLLQRLRDRNRGDDT